MAAKGRDPRRERLWRKAMSAWRASGLGIRAYCRRHGLTETGFHFWRRELLRRDAEPGGAQRAAWRFGHSDVRAGDGSTVSVRRTTGYEDEASGSWLLVGG